MADVGVPSPQVTANGVQYAAPGGQVPVASAVDPLAPPVPAPVDPLASIPSVYPTGSGAPAVAPDLPGGVPNVPAPAAQTAPALDRKPATATPGLDTAALERARQSDLDVGQAQLDAGAAKVAEKGAESEGAAKLAEQERAGAVDVAAENQAQQDGIAHARQAADAAQQEVKDFKFHQYFADKSTGSKIIAGLGVLFGAYAHGIAARTNPAARNIALDAIDANIAKDFEQQKLALRSKENFAAYKEKGVTDLSQQYKDDLARLQLKQSLAFKAVADQARSDLLKTGMSAVDAENNVIVKQFAAKADDTYAKGFQQLAHDKAIEALEQKKLNVSYAVLGETRREHDLANDTKRAALEEKAAAAEEKANKARDDRTVQLNDGSDLTLPSARAIPQFVDGYKTRTQAVGKLNRLLQDIESNPNPWSADAVAERERLLHDANIAVGSISSMGSSDHSTHLELGTLGPASGRKIPFIQADPRVAINAVKDKIKEIEEGTKQVISTYRKDRPKSETDNATAAGSTKAKDDASDIPSADKLKAIKDPKERQNAIEATAALADPKKSARARAYLKTIGQL